MCVPSNSDGILWGRKSAPLTRSTGGGGVLWGTREIAVSSPHAKNTKTGHNSKNFLSTGGGGGVSIVSRLRTGRLSSRSSIPGIGRIIIHPPQLPDPAPWPVGTEKNVFCGDKAAGT
jgi:hypothetical protein